MAIRKRKKQARGTSAAGDGEMQPRRKSAARKAAAARRPRAGSAAARSSAAAEPAAILAEPEVFPALPAFPVVGVGASAGGLDAFSHLLEALPPDPGLAFILVQHLAPRQESMLADLLSNVTRMPVVQVADGMSIEVNRVYVIPPNTQMAVLNGRLQLAPRPTDRSQYRPIDFFFRSLASNAQARAIGIVLSGSDSDGAEGLREIKGAGGIAIAQEPKTAQYDGMPRAAIATGIVDLVLSPPAIAAELTNIVQHPFVQRAKLSRLAEGAADDDKLQRIFTILRNVTGVDFSNYKQPTIRRRLQRRMVLHKITSIDRYLKYLQQNSAEVKALYQDILIHVTRFFRDPETFAALQATVFPKILSTRSGEQPIRIWVPGCSTGEEAYSVAICLLEHLGDAAASVPVQIFATDVSETAIEHARSGVYTDSISADVSAERLRRFFTKHDGRYRVSKIVRDMCIFARQDLTRDPPFSKVDLILCRNVLIYLGPLLQKRLMGIFHYALKPNGFLVLGNAETVGPASDLFAVADKKHRLYMKKLAVRAEVEFPAVDYLAGRSETPHKPNSAIRSAGGVQNEANHILLTRYAPPGVIVDSDMRIVHFRGQTGMYLEPAPGEPTLNLLKMAREGLLYGLRTALHEARKANAVVRKEGMRVKHAGVIHDVTLEVVPLSAQGEARHFLVLFRQPARAADEAEPPKPARGKKARARGPERQVVRLQEELAASREYLQSIIQDLEAANEELQSANEETLSANEELQSTNEELDTAKEELQSTNEELNTVNEELQSRNEELSRVNSDLLNLLGSVQLAIVMVASDLRIRRFTPMAEKVLNLIPTDIGRPISDIKPNIDCPELEKLIVDSIETVGIQERVCRDRFGNVYTLRIRPYKSLDNRIDGAVLALFDVQSPSRDDERSLAEEIIAGSPRPLLVVDEHLHLRYANPAYCMRFQTMAAELEGASLHEIASGAWGGESIREAVNRVISDAKEFGGLRVEHEFPRIGRRSIVVCGYGLRPTAGAAALAVLTFDDTTAGAL